MKTLRVSIVIWFCLLLTVSVSAVDNSFKLDFDGDGRADLALYREGSRSVENAPQLSYWHFLSTRTGQTWSIQWGRSLDVPLPADYDNDGKTDTAIYRWWNFDTGDTNEWWLGKSTGGYTVLVYEWEIGSYLKFSRNYIGDGRAEMGYLAQRNMNANPDETCSISVFVIGDLDDFTTRKAVSDVCNVVPTPVPGDYNNDGRSEIAVFTNQTFKVWYPPYNPLYTTPDITQSLNVDFPAPGDYDGDGKTDFAGTRAQAGRLFWRIKQSSNGTETEVDFGISTDKPAPGDYDGDGKTDIAVFRPSDASWWIRNSSSGVVSSWTFGHSTDIPLAMPVIPFDPSP